MPANCYLGTHTCLCVVFFSPCLTVKKYINTWLTNHHQCELKALLHRFPVDLVGQISKSHIACSVRKLTRQREVEYKWDPLPLKKVETEFMRSYTINCTGAKHTEHMEHIAKQKTKHFFAVVARQTIKQVHLPSSLTVLEIW